MITGVDLNDTILVMIVPTMMNSWKRCSDAAILNTLDIANIAASIVDKVNMSSP